MDLADLALGEHRQGMLGNIGVLELVDGLGKDAADIRRYIALTDDDCYLLRQIEDPIPVIGMAVVPAHKLGRCVAPRQILAGNAQFPVSLRTAGEDHRMVGGLEFRNTDVVSHGHIAEEGKCRGTGDLVIDQYRLLELRMIGGDPIAYQSKRGGQPFEHVDPHGVPRFNEGLGGIESARSATDDGHPQGILL
jgi:hypothetical protein